MQESVGGIVYDEAFALAYGGLFDTEDIPDTVNGISRLAEDVELLLVTEEEEVAEENSVKRLALRRP